MFSLKCSFKTAPFISKLFFNLDPMPSKYKVSNLCVQVIANVFYIECRELLNWYDELHTLDISGFPRAFMCLDSDHMFILVYINSYLKLYSIIIKRNKIVLPFKSIIISVCYLGINQHGTNNIFIFCLMACSKLHKVMIYH